MAPNLANAAATIFFGASSPVMSQPKAAMALLPACACSIADSGRSTASTCAPSSANSLAEAAPMPEELSEAELRIVRYLPSNLKAHEIAAELFVSTNTVKTHLRHIYAKLDAHSRAEAVARARELRLVAPGGRVR